MPLYWQVAAHLPRLLKGGGSYLAIIPHYSLPTILSEVGRYLKYRWLLCMWQAQGPHPCMAMGIEVLWKPIAWWVNEAWPQGRGFVPDGFENTPTPKTHHPWQQSLSWAEYCLRLVPPGSTILDPFLGSGTTALAALKRGHPFIGIEQDPTTLTKAKERIQTTFPDLLTTR